MNEKPDKTEEDLNAAYGRPLAGQSNQQQFENADSRLKKRFAAELPAYGPHRRAPRYYIGESVGGYRTSQPGAARYPNGALPGIRNKAARRVIRKAFLRSHSKVENGIRNTRLLSVEALNQASDEKRSTRWGRRLLAKELALHVPVDMPNDLRAERREARANQRKVRKQQKKAAKLEAAQKKADNLDMLEGFTK